MNCPAARDLFPSLLDPRTAATEHLEARLRVGLVQPTGEPHAAGNTVEFTRGKSILRDEQIWA